MRGGRPKYGISSQCDRRNVDQSVLVPRRSCGGQSISEFKVTKYLEAQHIKIHPIPPRRPNKNVLESKHRVIGEVYLRHQSAQLDQNKVVLVQQALRISNDLSGNDVAS